MPAVIQITRTSVANNMPVSGSLAPGQLAIEMASVPPRLWVGVPAGIDAAMQKMLLPAPGGVTIGDAAPATPNAGDLWWDSVGGNLFVRYVDVDTSQWVIADTGGGGGLVSPITYLDMPPSAQQMQFVFSGGGLPAAGGLYHASMAMAATVPAALAGTTAYANVAGTAAAVFTLNKVSGGVVTALGTITITGTAATLAGAGGTLAAGDALQLVAPAVQDATLSDVSITLLALRV